MLRMRTRSQIQLSLLGFVLLGIETDLRPSHAQWDDTFFSQTGVIFAMAADSDGNLFAGGQFANIAEFNAFPGTRNLVQGDGQRWWQVGGGVNGRVNALAFHGNDLYVGGSFTVAGTTSMQSLARWDGNDWTRVGSDVNGEILALAWEGSNLYVGGRFSEVGALAVSAIARWDGTQWRDMGGVFLGSEQGVVHAIVVHDSHIYVGGRFDRIGDIPAQHVARWDGTNWQALGTGTDGVQLLWVQALSVHSSGKLFAGGVEAGSAGQHCPLFEWKEDRWEATPLRSPGDNAGVRAMAWLDDVLYVGAGFFHLGDVGGFYYPVAAFDGANWFLPEVPFRAGVLAMEVVNGGMYVSGASGIPLSRGRPITAYFDGSAWSVIGKGGQGGHGAINALGIHQGSVVAGGYLPAPTRTGTDCIADWNGQIWSTLGSREVETTCSEVLAVKSLGNLLLSGTAEGVQAWDGTNWVVLGTGSPVNVRAMENAGDDLFCGSPGGLWRWDGSSWHHFGISNSVNALLYDDGVLYAAGGFTQAGATPVNHIAQWNGTDWQSLGEGADGPVHCLLKRGEILYAGGEFSTAGGVPASRIACWNGHEWRALGGGFSRGMLPNGNVVEPIVRALALSEHGLIYAGGNFTVAEGRAANHLAMWNGRNWLPLGGGVTNFVRALLWHENKLFVGGDFSYAGQTRSSRIAVWHESPSLAWSYRPGDHAAVLWWPSAFSGYVLETKHDLAANDWARSTNQPAVAGDRIVTTNGLGPEQRFFRLRKE
jgi:trimeric autotransporter adhesin